MNYLFRDDGRKSYELLLECNVKNESDYEKLVNKITEGREVKNFSYDTNFKECIISESTDIVAFDRNGDGEYTASGSYKDNELYYSNPNIVKMLYSDEEQKMVFVIAYDGIPHDSMSFPCAYFERFGIDPLSVADNVEYVTSDPLSD